MLEAMLLSAAVLTPGGNADMLAKPFPRLPAATFDVTPPSARIAGTPGELSVHGRDCREVAPAETRRRIVDVAVQEWGFFGFPVVDQTVEYVRSSGARRRWWTRRLDPVEGARIATTIAGYWAATPDGSWIVERQNGRWKGPDRMAARWRDPWSAAFISWVMCEGGVGGRERFRRSIAHYEYVDQAIRARDGAAAGTAFTAHDVGEAVIEPGDLLCSSRRNSYSWIGQRRRHLGVAARMHCDIVVRIEPERGRILAIGGNVRGKVSLKLFPASLRRNGRPAVFAHLKLRADSIGNDPLSGSPTFRALGCAPRFAARVATGGAAASAGDSAYVGC